MKYLIAVDGSASADNAFQFAVKLFNKENDQLFVISCVEEWGFDYIDDISGAISMAEVGQLNQAMEKNSTKVLSHYSDKCRDLGIECVVLKSRGKAKDIIVERAKELGIDLLVVGSRGLGPLSRLFLGSVSDYLVKNSPCPVLVVREKETTATASTTAATTGAPTEKKDS
eukprot:TRINITY_DN12467_c0_g1_i1.p1 TRINITY_DN12467_c0_g1~~TRINITY_DN12467_c0_g1_i1.p1  ORF type:complete len:170 (+),score=44.12 TRINITY_DN12467_c0_g1_i1:124-633(+)